MVPDILLRPSYNVALFHGVAGNLMDGRVGRALGVIDNEGDRWLGRVVCFVRYQDARGWA